MPAPIEVPTQYNRPIYSTSFGSSYPRQDTIDFGSLYDSLQQSINTHETEGEEFKTLESEYCRNFSCCNILLGNLHDLLQHYEEYHVKLEDDFQDWSDGSAPNSPSTPTKPLSGSVGSNGNPNLKRMAPSSFYDPVTEQIAYGYDDSSAFDTNVLRSSLNANSHKRRNVPTSNGYDNMAAQYQRLAIASQNLGHYPDLRTPTDEELFHHSALFVPSNYSANSGNFMITAEELMLRKQEALNTMEQHISRPSSTLVLDKPYKCSILGCDKAYKNPNGLKYHNQHGHCNLQVAHEGEKLSFKPYQCPLPNCGKKYKNLNGLKYHVEHQHPESGHEILGIPGSPDSSSASNIISNMPTPMMTPLSSPLLTPLLPMSL